MTLLSLLLIHKNGSAAAEIQTVPDTSGINLLIRKSAQFKAINRIDFDSALHYIELAEQLNRISQNRAITEKILRRQIELFNASGNYSFTLERLLKLLQFLDQDASADANKAEIEKKYCSLYTEIGLCYFNMENIEQALLYFRKSMDYLNNSGDIENNKDLREMQIKIYNNIGSCYLHQYRYQEAEPNFLKALELNSKNANPGIAASIYNNLGIVNKEKKNFPLAFEYYKKSLGIRQLLGDSALIAQTCNNLGDAFMLTGNTDSAVHYLTIAFRLSENTGNLRSRMKAANFLSQVYEEKGNFADALNMQRIFKSLHDSIISNESVQNSIRLELQYQYEKQKRETELVNQVILAEKEKKILISLVIIAILTLVSALFFFINRNQRLKLAQSRLRQQQTELERKNLELEKNNLEMKNRHLQMDLEFKNKELSTHVLYLLRKNEFIGSIIERLIEIRNQNQADNNQWIQEILRELQSNVDQNAWVEFEKRFQEVHEDFYKKLLNQYPDLTPNEIKICAFLKLNMTTKEISAITFQSVKSIQVARNRMRKKMGIDREENLISIIQQIS